VSDPAALARAGSRVGSALLLGVLPIALTAFVIGSTIHSNTFLYDFHGDLYDAGVAILHGRDPYQAALFQHLAAIARSGRPAPTTFATPVYPAPILLLATPLALLPYTAAALTFTAISIAALIAGLHLLGVRDPRCYGAAFLSWPVLHRERTIASAAALAAAVAAKLFLWPVALFPLARRRYRTAVSAVALGAGVTLGAWAVIDFHGLTTYPRLLSDLSTVEAGAGVSFDSLAHALGVARALGTAAGLAVSVALIVLAYVLCRRPGAGLQRNAFALLVLASLTASPLVWPHYLTLLFVAIALLSPSFGPLWLAPLLAWLAPVELTHGRVIEVLLYLAIELTVAACAVAPLLRRPTREVGSGSASNGDFANRPVGEGPTVRLGGGLESTSSRSHIASQRPNKGPGEPHYTGVEDPTPRTANRPT
jgi:hypothetical protein